MIRLIEIQKQKHSPKVLLYIIKLQNKRECFLKIGISGFIHITYSSFESFGFKIAEVATWQFSCKEHAIKELQVISDQYVNMKYIPSYEFPEPDNCFDVAILDGLNLQEFAQPLQESKSPAKDIEDQVIKLLTEENKKPGEVASELGIPAYQVSRIKKKYGL